MQLPLPKRPTAPANILIAAANQAGTKARKIVLEEKGHHVTVANKAKDALQMLENDSLSLVIVDFNLEQGKGLALLAQVCELAPQMPTILLADPLQGIEADMASCQPDLVVAKQFDEVDQLVKAVDKLLRRRIPRKRPGTIPKRSVSNLKKHG